MLGTVRTALICHHDNALNREVLPGFLASFSELAGVVVITEQRGRRRQRLVREWRRSGIRTLDVLAFRLYYRLFLARGDRAWVQGTLQRLRARYPIPAEVKVFHTDDPNSEATREFLLSIEPDLVLARCKSLLRPGIYEAPADGTFIVHPGICPEYRNAHGCFWALARRDLERVGATLLRIDAGVDTGPPYAYYGTEIDESRESHLVIEYRVVYDNLDRLATDLQRVHAGETEPIDVSGRGSAAWGQPRLSDYLRWKQAARADEARA
jgi:folate-dependent phosphoribosylglycinamide formyltransferase PurN